MISVFVFPVYDERGAEIGWVSGDELNKQLENLGFKIIKLNNDKGVVSLKEE